MVKRPIYLEPRVLTPGAVELSQSKCATCHWKLHQRPVHVEIHIMTFCRKIYKKLWTQLTKKQTNFKLQFCLPGDVLLDNETAACFQPWTKCDCGCDFFALEHCALIYGTIMPVRWFYWFAGFWGRPHPNCFSAKYWEPGTKYWTRVRLTVIHPHEQHRRWWCTWVLKVHQPKQKKQKIRFTA